MCKSILITFNCNWYIILFLLVFTTPLSYANKITINSLNERCAITIIFSTKFGDKDQRFIKQLETKLSSALPKNNLELLSINITNHKNYTSCIKPINDSNLVIAVGQDSFNYALLCTNHNIPILTTIISENSYYATLNKYKKSINKYNITAIFLEQPVARHLSLITAIAKKNYINLRLGIITSNGSLHYANNLIKLAATKNINLTTMLVENEQELLKKTAILLKTCNFLLVLPDPNILNNQSGHGLLITALSNFVPVIGYSNAYVKVGALAAIFTSREQVALETTNLAKAMLKNPTNKIVPQYPKNFSIAINKPVSNMLSVRINPQDELHKLISENDF